MLNTIDVVKPPLPPFTSETAKAKVQAAEDAWNTRDPERVSPCPIKRNNIFPFAVSVCRFD